MRTRLPVVLNDAGVPTAQVPFPCMWDLVEFLSYRRVNVTYQYQASHFTVTFPRQDVDSAQRVLDDWAKVSSMELQPA